MIQGLQARTVRGRAAKQERSERTRGAIVRAVLEVLADVGAAGLTHRVAAQRSGAALAATTYYFATKEDMVAAASNELLHTYLGDFTARVEVVPGQGSAAFRRFVAEMIALSVSDYRDPTLAWCEIMLDGARHAEARALARDWFERMIATWTACARRLGVPDPEAAGATGMDLTLGGLLHGVALGLDRAAAEGAFYGAPEAALVARLPAPGDPAPPSTVRPSRRGGATRERILDAAIRLLGADGAGAVNYRAVAAEAGLTPGAPAYHFPTVDRLLAEAQALLFVRSKARYRDVIGGVQAGLDRATLADISGAIFQSEMTEFGASNLATHALWLQAAREPALRPLVQEAVGDLHRGWSYTLSAAGAPRGGPESLFAQYLFVGAFVRTLACGSAAADVAATRARLKAELSQLIEGRHWLQAAG